MQNVKLLSGFVFAAFLIFNFTFYISPAFAQVSSCRDGQTACPQGCTLGVNCASCWSQPICTIRDQTAATCGSCQCPSGQVVCSGACQAPAATQGQPCNAGPGAGSGTVNQCGVCVANSPRNASRQYISPGIAEEGHINVVGNIATGGSITLGGVARTFWPAASQWITGSGGAIYYSGGNVGVGTTAPTQRLEVSDDTDGVARLRISDTEQNPELQLKFNTGDNDHWGLYVDRGDANKIKLWGVGDIGNNRLTVNTDGWVGIGTTTPSERLDVDGNLRTTGNLILSTSNATVDGVNLDNVLNNLTPGTGINIFGTGNTRTIALANGILTEESTINWSQLGIGSFPGACSIGQFVTAVGSTLTCATPSGGAGTVSGTGSTNSLAKFTGVSTLGASLGASILTETSGTISVGGSITATDCFGPVFKQGSVSAVNGNRGGYGASVCPAEMHICRTDEILNSVQCGSTIPASESYWVLEGPPGYTAAANDCRGLMSDATGDLGTYWDFAQGEGGVGWMTPCSSELQFACCQ